MCGIVAAVSSEPNDLENRVRRGVETLTHRGPDCQKQWIDRTGRVALGHARLSIIDLNTGDQPIANEDESLHIVANGEFYNHDAIMAELEKKGHRFRTRSDSEIALHLYEEYGCACLDKLRGEFAFVIWDAKNNTLFAARDRFGIKPLFYTWHEGTLYFASEVKALFAAGVPAQWSLDAIQGFSEEGPGAPSETLYRNIRIIPPGNYLISGIGRPSQTYSYWDFDYPEAAALKNPKPLEAYVEGFRDVFNEAVNLRLRSDVPLGCYLSGGLDSCAVLGAMSALTNDPVQAFTLTFDQDDYNEHSIAEEMAAHVGADYHPIPISQADIADNFSDAIWHSETICINGHGVGKFLLSRAVRDAGFKVVYTGEGSDEILAGYPHFRQDMLLENADGQNAEDLEQALQKLRDANPVSKGVLLPDSHDSPMETVKKLLGFVPTWLRNHAGRAAFIKSIIHPDFKLPHRGRDYSRLFFNELDIPRQLTGRDPLNQSLYLWSKTALPNYLLTVLGDRMEMAHSIEGRVPFLDHKVVEFMTQVPIQYKIHGMTEKFLLKEAAKPQVTKTIYERQKHPYLSPPATITPDEPLFALVQDTLRGPALRNMPCFDQNTVIEKLDSMHTLPPGKQLALDTHLMILTSLCTIQERFKLTW